MGRRKQIDPRKADNCEDLGQAATSSANKADNNTTENLDDEGNANHLYEI